MGYSTPYTIFLTALAIIGVIQISAKWTSVSQKIFMALSFLISLVFIGTRGYVQTDYYNYYTKFQEIPNMGPDLIEYLKASSTDIGFLIYTYLLKNICDSYFFFIFVSTLIDFVLLTIFFKRYLKKPIYALFLIVFFYYGGLILELNLLRNVKSILLFCLSIKYIESKQPLKYLILNLIGLSLHWSSIVFIPLYLILNIKTKERTYWIMLASALVIFFVSPYILKPVLKAISSPISVVGERTLSYLDVHEYARPKNLSVGDLIRLVMAIITGLSFKQLTKSIENCHIFINMYLIYLFTAACGHGMEIIQARLGNLFCPSMWIIFPALILCSGKLYKPILYSAICLICISGTIILTKNEEINYYDSWLITPSYKSFEEREKTLMQFHKEHSIINSTHKEQ